MKNLLVVFTLFIGIGFLCTDVNAQEVSSKKETCSFVKASCAQLAKADVKKAKAVKTGAMTAVNSCSEPCPVPCPPVCPPGCCLKMAEKASASPMKEVAVGTIPEKTQ